MRFLLDQGLARSAVEHLRQAGIESVHVGDLGMAAASDVMILEEGLKRNAVVVTLDADFHSLLALSNATTPSVIRIRMEGLKGIDVSMIIQRVAEAAREDLEAGAAVTVTDRRIAIKRLPLIRAKDQDEKST
jgi:predicted nuclease of predicted toxin-antitoxin system